MSLFPRSFEQEFSPIFRLMDDYASLTHDYPSLKTIRSFQPKFDVSESKEAYTLHGDLPGIAQKDISVEWTDNNTLTISGHSEQSYESGGPASQGKREAQQPSVEDAAVESDTPQQQDSVNAVATTEHTSSQEIQKSEDAPKYWVSERSSGKFSRSFTFPERVDPDGVKANLKNGVLEILVPKTGKPPARKVTVE